MSESKTPRTDSVKSEFELHKLCRQLELETAELKAKLAESKANHRALAETSIRIHAEQEAKLAEFERQKKEGELVTVRTIIEWLLWEWEKLSDEAELQKSIQEYAVRRQKDGGECVPETNAASSSGLWVGMVS